MFLSTFLTGWFVEIVLVFDLYLIAREIVFTQEYTYEKYDTLLTNPLLHMKSTKLSKNIRFSVEIEGNNCLTISKYIYIY